MRGGRGVGKIVLGGDDARGLAGGAWKRLQLEGPLSGAEIDAGEIFRLTSPRFLLPLAALGERSHLVRGKALGIARKGRGDIAVHPLQYPEPVVDVVVGAKGPVDGVTAHAAFEHSLLFLRPGSAQEPLGVRELGLEILGGAEYEIDRRRAPCGNGGRVWAVEVIAHGANAQGVEARIEPARGEAVPAGGVGDHANGDRGALPLRGDHHALHRAFGFGCDLPGQGIVRLGSGDGAYTQRRHRQDGDDYCCACEDSQESTAARHLGLPVFSGTGRSGLGGEPHSRL